MDLDLHEALPVSPTLPATFGSTDNDEWDSVDEGVQNLARTLRVSNLIQRKYQVANCVLPFADCQPVVALLIPRAT